MPPDHVLFSLMLRWRRRSWSWSIVVATFQFIEAGAGQTYGIYGARTRLRSENTFSALLFRAAYRALLVTFRLPDPPKALGS